MVYQSQSIEQDQDRDKENKFNFNPRMSKYGQGFMPVGGGNMGSSSVVSQLNINTLGGTVGGQSGSQSFRQRDGSNDPTLKQNNG